jgi:hypothetical protein
MYVILYYFKTFSTGQLRYCDALKRYPSGLVWRGKVHTCSNVFRFLVLAN